MRSVLAHPHLRLAAPAAGLCAFLCPLAATDVSAQQSVFSPVVTVSDATFRSRWAGPQVDEGGGIALTPVGEGIRPVGDLASKLREGLSIGSLRIRPGMAVGWDYSDRNYEGQATSGVNNDQSFYIAPSLGLEYARDTGPWSLAARYGGAYTYFLNPDYSASGTEASRNPFNNTASFGVGHSGTRHSAQLSGQASYGNGENIQANGFTTTFAGGATLSYDYLINEFLTTGSYVSYTAQLTRYEQDNQNGSDLVNIKAGAYIDWLATGKTTAGIRLEAGRVSSQIIDDQADVPAPAPTPSPTPVAVPGATPTPSPTPQLVQADNEVQSRQYGQILVAAAHNLTAKVLLFGGLGASYTVDENVIDAESQYTGLRPAYMLGVQFDSTEKTSIRAYTTFLGADVVPSYGLSLTWRPRLNTLVSFSAYQTQNFSITSIDQFQVNRGFVVSLQQVLFSKLTLDLSAGWQQTENVSLSSDIQTSGSTDYAFAGAGLSWRINSWASWVATVRTSTGNQYQQQQAESQSVPETTASIGLNLLF